MGSVSTTIPANPTRRISTNLQWPRVEANVTIIVAGVPSLEPWYIAIVKKLPSTIGSHDPSKHWNRARNYAAGLRRKGTCSHIGDAPDADPEARIPIEMMTYVSSGPQKDSGSGKGLVYNAAMPGITAETDIRISRADIPR